METLDPIQARTMHVILTLTVRAVLHAATWANAMNRHRKSTKMSKYGKQQPGLYNHYYDAG